MLQHSRWAAQAKPSGGQPASMVLGAMAAMSTQDGLCWPTVNALARIADAPERRVRTALASLEADGLIAREPTPPKWRGGQIWRLNMPAAAVEPALAPEPAPPKPPRPWPVRQWLRLPLYFRAAATLCGVAGLSQAGFRLMSLHSTPAFILGGLCLVLAPWIALLFIKRNTL